jgi:hypothetical protein
MLRVLGTAHEAKLLNGNWPATGFCIRFKRNSGRHTPKEVAILTSRLLDPQPA